MSAAAPLRGPERIRRALTGGYPILYVQSWEEPRVERALTAFAQKLWDTPIAFSTWTCVDGLVTGTARLAAGSNRGAAQ